MKFEECIDKVNKALEELNKEDLSLDTSIKIYKNALLDIKKAREILDNAKLEVEKIDE
ncbi:exodeoxyribonuclease VII small subunit [uncultured Campylobacter sp.]|uniref:exodeoxyribonuclease VII small subunit n=1 Tax=uncultured Campylobacter sp. TaxID=218934 RepID=UPI00262634E1|nr:exodeoxyribonuclease VII small subunit [uncultured Campylobacter sp.]